MVRYTTLGAGLVLCGFPSLAIVGSVQGMAQSTDIERGRYLVKIGGCNDCHTPGYLTTAGKVPEKDWLVGDAIGFSGPWGTTYPSNLRGLLAKMSENEWVRYARSLRTRPPMPWFNLQAFAEDDLRAMHRYIRSLPKDDRSVPDFVAPGQRPSTPHIVMVPQAPG